MSPLPIINLDDTCDSSVNEVNLGLNPGAAEYAFSGVRDFNASFTLQTECACGTGRVDIPQGGRINHVDGTISLRAGFPGLDRFCP
jgi:hypothetical protein